MTSSDVSIIFSRTQPNCSVCRVCELVWPLKQIVFQQDLAKLFKQSKNLFFLESSPSVIQTLGFVRSADFLPYIVYNAHVKEGITPEFN